MNENKHPLKELAIAISTQQKCQFSDFICFQYYRAELYKSDMKKI